MIIEIPVGKSSYKISCKESERSRLTHLAYKLNERINKLALNKKDADEKTLLVIAALSLEDELENEIEGNQDNCENERNKVNEDILNALSDNMENITKHIQSLTRKIQNY